MNDIESWRQWLLQRGVRYYKKQKKNFLHELCEQLEQCHFEYRVQGNSSNKNLVIGNIDAAKLVITAHYDTALQNLFDVPEYFDQVSIWKRVKQLPKTLCNACFGITANPHNANDNSSGVLAVLMLMQQSPKTTAFVLFDNEESGGFGSKAYDKCCPQAQTLPHINLDCIGYGTRFSVLYNQGCQTLAQDLAAHYLGDISCEQILESIYFSDSCRLNNAVTVAGFQEDSNGKRYNSRIHSRFDTILDVQSVQRIIDMILSFSHTF